MKKTLLVLVLIATLVALLPSAALGASPAVVSVRVRNQTGGSVHLSLSLPGGTPIFTTLEEGVTSFTTSDGLYNYYASTPCGNMSGQWNINMSKTLYLSCKTGAPATTLTKFANRFKECDEGLYVVDGGIAEFNSWQLFGGMIIDLTLSTWSIVIQTPQEAADIWNEQMGGGGKMSYYAGCYDGVAEYNLP